MLYKGNAIEECLAEFDKQVPVYSNKVASQVKHIREAIEFYSTSVYPLYRGRVRAIEVEENLKLFDIDIPFTFRIDLETTDGILVDHKTVGGRAPSIEYSEQMDLYSALYLGREGHLPRMVEHHLAYKRPGRKARVEVKTRVPKLTEILKTVSKIRTALGMIDNDVLPAQRGRHCRYCPFQNECDRLIVSSDGSHTIT